MNNFMVQKKVSIGCLPTGVPGLDNLLGGGLPEFSFNLIAETPGSGKTMGIKLAVDDFGTGYSSLSYLRRFPIDTLKIDRSFVKEMTNDPDDATIVRAVVGMGKSLKQHVIAEGVETAAQHASLLAEHYDEGQGYYSVIRCRPRNLPVCWRTAYPNRFPAILPKQCR